MYEIKKLLNDIATLYELGYTVDVVFSRYGISLQYIYSPIPRQTPGDLSLCYNKDIMESYGVE